MSFLLETVRVPSSSKEITRSRILALEDILETRVLFDRVFLTGLSMSAQLV